ncbi:hypothetical protein JXI42_00200 [bacterium]|nr:hypothetical protein [bacterium]
MKTLIKFLIPLLLFVPIISFAGSWSASGEGDLGCTIVTIPAGSRYVTFDLNLEYSDSDDDYDLWVYFPTRTDCSTEDCRPERSAGWDETCGPYNPYTYDPSSVCGDPDEEWRVRITEENYCYDGWDLEVNWVDCNVGNNCGNPIGVNLPADLPYLDWHQLTCGRDNDYTGSCLGTYDDGEDIIYRVVVDISMTVDILLNPYGTAGTGFCVTTSCPPGGSCIAQSTNAGSGEHGVTDLDLSPGTYYIMVSSDPALNSCIPDFDLSIVAPVDCSNPMDTIYIPADLPYELDNQFTCGRIDNYYHTCLDLLDLGIYDSGEDILYMLIVTDTFRVDIVVDPGNMISGGTPATGLALDSVCPPSAPCMAYSRGPVVNLFAFLETKHGIYNHWLFPGTYWIMVDTWDEFADCIPYFTLYIDESKAGNDCIDPIIVHLPGDLTYVDAYQTTDNREDYYSSTCLGAYDEAQEIIYQINTYEDLIVDIILTPHNGLILSPPWFVTFLMNGTGLALDDTCPPEGSCITFHTQSGATEHRLSYVPLHASVGTYYLMVDGAPGGFPPFVVFDDFYFTLTIEQSLIIDDPPDPTTTEYPCGPQTLTRVGTPPAGVTWYWQGRTCGEVTTLGSGPTFEATESGTYYIRARHDATGVWSFGCGSVEVTVVPLPERFNIAGGGEYCAGGDGMPIILNSSQVGVEYQLYLDGAESGSPVYGTGTVIGFGLNTEAGTYFAVGTDTATGCLDTMNGTVNISVYNDDDIGTWTGYVDTNWSDPDNWGMCTLPDGRTDITIPGAPAYGRYPTVDTDDGTCTCNKMTNNGELNGGSGNLFVNGTWENNGNFNAGTGTITFTGFGGGLITGAVTTDFNIVKMDNSGTPVNPERNIGAEEIDGTTPGNEGLDLRDGDEIDIRDP